MTKAVVLAAGIGSRMSRGENDQPKILLKIGNVRIIDRVLRGLAAERVTNVKIVVGYRAELIMDYVSRKYQMPNFEIEYVYNPWYASSNTACSLWLASSNLGLDDVILINGDIILVDEAVERLLSLPNSCLLGIRHECGEEEVKILEDDQLVVEIGKNIDPAKAWGEYIGLGKFAPREGNLLREALGIANYSERSSLFYEDVLNRILNRTSIIVVDGSDLPIREIDTPVDLERWIQEFGGKGT
jgi:choline kinase